MAERLLSDADLAKDRPPNQSTARESNHNVLFELMLMRRKQTGPSSGVLMKAAMDYGRIGWSVVPIEPLGEVPTIDWEVYRHRRPETAEIGDWFTRWPNANLAVVTGVVSDLVVLVLDARKDGKTGRARLEQDHGPMPETVEAQIDDGVRHMYFRHPGGILHGCSALGAGIELHGDGNYVVVPPSIHASGESYRWVRSPDVFPLAPLPIGLSRTLVVRDQTANPVAHWQHLSQTETAEGWRREAIASLAGYLLGKGVDGKVVLELMLCWNAIRCRPPLTPDAVIREVDRIEHR